MRISSILKGLVTGTALFAASVGAAQDWTPPGPVKLQIGFGAGGETDTIGRVIATVMKEQTGWNVIAENKPGGGGVAMFTGISAAPADGTVIGMGVTMPVMINLVLRGDELPFDVDSFDYLATVARAPLAIVAKADAPFEDMKGLVAHAKEHGGAVAFDAKPQELLMRAIDNQESAGFKLVPTKSSAEMLQLVLGGQVDASFSAGVHIPYVKKGDLKMIATANDGRHGYAPDVASLPEQGYAFYVDPIFYFAAPAGLPDDAKAALAAALDAAIQSDRVVEVVTNVFSSEPDNRGPDGTRKVIVDGVANVRKLFGK
ncbi:tripartite tricarboxylate transporter substrate binding protein [Pukyongiella litopenaei]|uniref:Tripartite tricarboxylate transporter substrate binding protein n=1 Tax=Pukyongiella litopenaei TaxID=2605946 RepID=A0A2S0MQL7_9RHOB|nr:tripartite tricarboxylate transporter substrate binding protein [Pukyongiella litopenaei]AVO38164.1 tripartite tricarboxylate transporter substrate binding protein [Pukyongiella litopenaei]